MASESLTSQDVREGTRGMFPNTAEYLLACIGLAIGLGNVWAFPRRCLENGGGAFLLPYLVIVVVIGAY